MYPLSKQTMRLQIGTSAVGKIHHCNDNGVTTIAYKESILPIAYTACTLQPLSLGMQVLFTVTDDGIVVVCSVISPNEKLPLPKVTLEQNKWQTQYGNCQLSCTTQGDIILNNHHCQLWLSSKGHYQLHAKQIEQTAQHAVNLNGSAIYLN